MQNDNCEGYQYRERYNSSRALEEIIVMMGGNAILNPPSSSRTPFVPLRLRYHPYSPPGERGKLDVLSTIICLVCARHRIVSPYYIHYYYI